MRIFRILILGGTGDSARLIPQLAALPNVELIASLAGRTPKPNIPNVGQVRMGGFGGIDGLVNYLKTEKIDLLLDMTHPFAAQITRNAAIAAQCVGIPRLVFCRPAWEKEAGDRWITAMDHTAAAKLIPEIADRVFLTIGRQELSAFATVVNCWFLMRMITLPSSTILRPPGEILLDQGPFDLEKETELLIQYNIGAIVSKNSGGSAAQAKIVAARHLGLPIIMIPRPELPDGEVVSDLQAIVPWVECQIRSFGSFNA
jgi:precorrin-6A/cobalt-precorrin-6A reductase